MRTRLTRVERNEQTRRSLLEAARRLFVAQGFHATSLDTVADTVGLTKGAVYSRFPSKADLFLALLEERIEERMAQVKSVIASGRVEADIDALIRQWADLLRSDLGWTLVVVEFRVHVARDPDLNRRYAALHRRNKQLLLEAVEATFDAAGVVPAPAAEEFVDWIFTVSAGTALEFAADPAALSVDVLDAWTLRFLSPASTDAARSTKKRGR